MKTALRLGFFLLLAFASMPLVAQTRVGGTGGSGGASGMSSGGLSSGGSGFANRNVRGGGSLGGGGSNQSASLSGGLLAQRGLEFGGGGVDRSQETGFFGAQQQSGSLFGGQGGQGGLGGAGGLGGVMQGLNNLFSGGNRGANGGNRSANGRNNQSRQMTYRPQRTVAFDTPRVTPQASAESINKFYKTTGTRTRGVRLASGGEVTAENQNGILVLSGRVSSAHDKALAERIALLEPGVTKVQNRLTVAASGSSLSGAPASSPSEAPRSPSQGQ